MGVTKTDSLYRKDYFGRLQELKKYAPDAFESFFAFNNRALAEGELSVKLKELIAVAVAHITGCPYCIDLHVKNVKKQKASKEEVAEAIFVATALKAGSAAAHGVNALNAYDGNSDEELYKASYFNRIKEFSKLNDETFKAFLNFDHHSIKAENLSEKEKELIAVACAHTTGCAYCINLHTKNAKNTGANLAEISEAIFVAVALKAGSAIAHSVNALNAFDE
ncbi:carboxymuconolactone decarboxylase family protein [Oceanobacillus profundus]|uniref:Alkylhydroperoxidase n=1 Tax=Oceanobacillus profundus TaxID=372463 RepID=A0A417YJP0_9BACI|nr:carboxymuconolactone decarboxylase family protein [Oceanobacillus profundus]MBR3120222.1 carboxymuconolactone decarboxylase family protein [Oceanobacillus sp.]PAE31105.1 alkylhydroperoxidase [Paenibacillus sp. 7884-2]MCM3396903.1 carboxymuconolactone decarboxylase family protein [Oceanobacillus profundus]MDO6448203.1 carboxymuconolactone decarboxylase family protein [Oceanobacillus profundus]RHW33200.1 alkylhydroperoxidase [Oceanobacillus profundus]